MISIKMPADIEKMRKAGKIAKSALIFAEKIIKPGVDTKTLDNELRRIIQSSGAVPSFLDYNGFSGNVCISINDEVIHGIPSKTRVLAEGDIVKIDVGAYLNGFHGDCADTFYCGDKEKMPTEIKKLIAVTKQSFFEGVKFATAKNRVGDIGFAIQSYVESFGFSVVQAYIGHGIGRKLHEAPEVPNFGKAGKGNRLYKGMTIAVEPMVNIGGYETKVLSDKWTVATADGSLSAHYENTILITDGECEILTAE